MGPYTNYVIMLGGLGVKAHLMTMITPLGCKGGVGGTGGITQMIAYFMNISA